MRRVIVFLAALAVAVLLGVGTAQADTTMLNGVHGPQFKGPQPASLKARTVAEVGAPGALVPVEGTLLDASRRPLTGVPVRVAVEGDPSPALISLTGSGGAFEVFVPLPEALPATGEVQLTVRFDGTADAAASSLTLPVRLQGPAHPAPAEVVAPAPAAPAPADTGVKVNLPTSGSPLLDQLIVVAGGVFGILVALIAVGAFLRRRRS